MHNHSRPLLFAMAILAGVASRPAHSRAATIVNVLLQDSSTSSSIQGMKMTAEPSTVRARKVTFHVRNASGKLVHEMIVVMRPASGKPLPYDATKNLLVESRIHSMGEVSERDPGQSGTLTLNLKAGNYLLICNQAGHYKGGMWTTLAVTP